MSAVDGAGSGSKDPGWSETFIKKPVSGKTVTISEQKAVLGFAITKMGKSEPAQNIYQTIKKMPRSRQKNAILAVFTGAYIIGGEVEGPKALSIDQTSRQHLSDSDISDLAGGDKVLHAALLKASLVHDKLQKDPDAETFDSTLSQTLSQAPRAAVRALETTAGGGAYLAKTFPRLGNFIRNSSISDFHEMQLLAYVERTESAAAFYELHGDMDAAKEAREAAKEVKTAAEGIYGHKLYRSKHNMWTTSQDPSITAALFGLGGGFFKHDLTRVDHLTFDDDPQYMISSDKLSSIVDEVLGSGADKTDEFLKSSRIVDPHS